MAETILIGCFLEDIGQERFIKALIYKIADGVNLDRNSLDFDMRNASGGGSAAVAEFRRFLRDYVAGNTASFDILVVAIDGNCKGAAEQKNRLDKIREQSGYAGRVVYAIPDPHIEKWYMADLNACQQVLQTSSQPQCPTYKCEKDRYKQALTKVIRDTGVIPLQGGAEYAPDIAEKMNLYQAGKNDESLERFISDMRSELNAFRR
ncbi:MAG TPA: hypothetical protein VFB21_18470 [Chthonomonadaceae bacterium]|nr:hypothetical protein [Chthonomonadaceae bacterium]